MRHKISTSGTVKVTTLSGEAMETTDCSFGYFISPMEWMSLNEHRGKVSFFSKSK